MSLKRFIKEKISNILFNLLLIIIVNLYLLVSNPFKDYLGDLIYIDIILIILGIVYLFISYRKYKSKYNYFTEVKKGNLEFNIEEANLKSLDNEMMQYIVNFKDCKYEEDINKYKESVNELEEYIDKWVHEIKLPISSITVILDRINDEDISENIRKQVEKINFLVNSVMYGGRASSASENIIINEENLQRLVNKSIKNNAFFLIKNNIEIEVGNLNYSIYTDGKCLIYVFGQIINNAIKYTKGKGKGKIEFLAVDNDKYIELIIRDNGIGIAKEDIKRVFDKGYTGTNGRNSVYKSTGMGLYFSKKILNKLNHEITVNSKVNEYTIFKIRFYKISDYLKVTKM